VAHLESIFARDLVASGGRGRLPPPPPPDPAELSLRSGEKLHAKAMVADSRRLIVGSANWTSSGFLHNHELDAVIESARLASQALTRMEADWAASA
jgi:phosphatidylserine/phosphatidylglycerophosphate/cardiolipin synthase-like enzyme